MSMIPQLDRKAMKNKICSVCESPIKQGQRRITERWLPEQGDLPTQKYTHEACKVNA